MIVVILQEKEKERSLTVYKANMRLDVYIGHAALEVKENYRHAFIKQ